MMTRDDDLRVKLGRIGNRGLLGRNKAFFAEVRGGAKKQGYSAARLASAKARPRGPSTRGRGRGAGAAVRLATGMTSVHMAKQSPHFALLNSTRRVVVKAHIVRHQGRKSPPLTAHIAYLKRDGVDKGGERAHLFGNETDLSDGQDFAERCQDDRHHFRFIVSPDDATEMSDLKAFTRELLTDMEYDLGTKLDWVAVEHHNTDNPHIHVLVRGKADDGKDLVIDRDYISNGIRARAQHRATLELGPRPEHEIRSALEREVGADRWTALDAALRRAADATGLADMRPNPSRPTDRHIRGLMIGRLQRLEAMGLTTKVGPSQWSIAKDAQATLRELGTRNDIIKTMHKALAEHGIDRPHGDYAIHKSAPPPIVGRLVAKGLHDDLTGETYAIVDGVDGRPHHIRFRDTEPLEHAPPAGGIVEVRRSDIGGRRTPTIAARSDLTIEAQITAPGATWLDRQLVSRERPEVSHIGFGREVREALQRRIDHLVSEGLARRDGQRVIFARQLIDTLRQRNLDAAAADIAIKNGLPYRPLKSGESVAGLYRARLSLASGRFAMIDDGLGFTLVPWKPSLERHLGQHVSGRVEPETVDWSFGRKRSLGIS
jgi:type IV secretory pathway VirD2 relaxase